MGKLSNTAGAVGIFLAGSATLVAGYKTIETQYEDNKIKSVSVGLRGETATLAERLIDCLQKGQAETASNQSGFEVNFSLRGVNDSISAHYTTYDGTSHSEKLRVSDGRAKNSFSENNEGPELPFGIYEGELKVSEKGLEKIDGVLDSYSVTNLPQETPEDIHKLYKEYLLKMLAHPQCSDS